MLTGTQHFGCVSVSILKSEYMSKFWNYVSWILNPIGKVSSYLTTKAAQDQVSFDETGTSKFSEWFKRNLPGVNNLWNRATGNALTTAEEQANQFSADEAQKQRDWETQMSNTAYQRQVADMKAAGINPALAMNGGASGASTPSGSAATSVTPGASNMSDLVQLFMMPLHMKLLKSQMKLQSAQAADLTASASKKTAETAGVSIDNAWKDRLYKLEAEGKEARNRLTSAEEKQVYRNIDKAIAETHKLYAEANTETEKQFMYQTEAMLNDAKAWQIAEMMPYEKALSEAKTGAEVASAAASFAQAAYQNGLINAGYIDALVNQANAGATEADARAEGEWFKNFVYRQQNATWADIPQSAVGEFSQTLVQSLKIIRQTIMGK